MACPIEGFQVVDARTRIRGAQAVEQVARQVDHKEGEAHCVVDRELFDAHEVLQTKVLLGVSEGKLDLEPQGIIVDESQGLQAQIAAEQNHMPHPSACQMGAHDNNDVEQIGKVLVQTGPLIHLGAIVAFGRARNSQCLGQIVVVEPGSVLETGVPCLLFLGG